MGSEGLSAQNHALVLRLLRVCAISPQMADVLVARWSQANLLLDAARDEGLAAAPEPVGHGLAEEGRRLLAQAERTPHPTHILNVQKWATANLPALLDSAEHAATLQSSHDLALAEAERLREAVTGAVTELSAMGHSCGNSMRALSALRAARKPLGGAE